MDNNDYKAGIERLRDWTFNNVESHFRETIVDDILDVGEVDYIIDDYDWYLYWLDLAKEIKTLMDNIIYDYQQGKEELREYLNECVELKQEIDKNLRANPHFSAEEVSAEMSGKVGIDKETETKHDYINIIGDEKKQETLKHELYKALSNKGFINTTQSSFVNHFRPYSGDLKKIQWYETEIQITALFHLSISNGIIDRSFQYRIHQTISNHFLNKKGKQFNARQLGVSLTRVKGGEVDHLIIDIVDLVKELTKIN